MKWAVSNTTCEFDERYLYFKKINEIYLERTYADNRLKRFKIKNVENSSTKQIEIYKMLNITSENSIDAMKKSNIINKNVRIDDEIRNEVARNIAESLNADNQIFENDVIDNNLSNLKTRNIHTRIKFSTRRSNWLIEIENSLSNVERSINTTIFATINEVSIKKNEMRWRSKNSKLIQTIIILKILWLLHWSFEVDLLR